MSVTVTLQTEAGEDVVNVVLPNRMFIEWLGDYVRALGSSLLVMDDGFGEGLETLSTGDVFNRIVNGELE